MSGNKNGHPTTSFYDANIYAVAKKVMLGISQTWIPSVTESRGAILTDNVTDILLELYQANSARGTYEAAIELPLDDLYYVGGQLQRLIRRAEQALRSTGPFLPEYQRYALSTRVDEAKTFRKYILRRIRNGS